MPTYMRNASSPLRITRNELQPCGCINCVGGRIGIVASFIFRSKKSKNRRFLSFYSCSFNLVLSDSILRLYSQIQCSHCCIFKFFTQNIILYSAVFCGFEEKISLISVLSNQCFRKIFQILLLIHLQTPMLLCATDALNIQSENPRK